MLKSLACSLLSPKIICIIIVVKMLWTQKVQLSKPHFDLLFTTTSTSKNIFFHCASGKRHCAPHLLKQPCLNSYQQRQISKSDHTICSSCGKKKLWKQNDSKSHRISCNFQLNFLFISFFKCSHWGTLF